MFPNKEIDLLFSIIHKETGLSREEVISKTRKPDYADARRVFAVIIKSNFKVSLRYIGEKLGGRDHATIISSIKKHEDLFDSNKTYTEKYNKINSKFLVSKLVSNKVSYSIRELKQKKSRILNQIEKDIVVIKRLKFKNGKKPSSIGLFIGSFNPIHNAHLMVANTVVNKHELDEVWFMFSDEVCKINGKENDLINIKSRILLLKNAIVDNPYFRLSKLDYKNENNSTSEHLLKLISEYNQCNFSLIMGADYLYDIDKLKSSEYIKQNFPILYYERGGPQYEGINRILREEYSSILGDSIDNKKVERIEGLIESNISSSKVRKILREENGVDKLKYIVPDACLHLLEEKEFYNTKKIKI
tara:strand:- start:925 stop:2001 length:1077 start_codon:yes stop_codon:yes gene_type:complete